MLTLGINAAYHDPAACLVRDGRVIAAAEEERFTHVKHGKRPVPFSTWELPFHAVDYCLREAGIRLGQGLEWLGQVHMPHSLGMLYERVTEYLGFLHGSDEYKVMALASYGRPRYLKEFCDIVRLGERGQY